MTIVEPVLRGIRTTKGTMRRVHLDPDALYPIPVRAPLVLCGLVAGSLTVDGIALSPGGAVILRGPHPVTPKAGNAGAVLLVCEYPAHANGLTNALPDVAVVPPDAADCATLLQLLDRRLDLDEPPTVRDRLLDWLLTCTLNAWYATHHANPPTALADPVIAPALAAIHADPARPWTVAELATHTGLSRAAFAKRFRSLVGSAPLAYLREWRMTLAAEYLTTPNTTISAVARRVGYANPFSFSAAFKRERGTAPSAHRGQEATRLAGGTRPIQRRSC